MNLSLAVLDVVNVMVGKGERFQLAKPSLTPQPVTIKRTAEEIEL